MREHTKALIQISRKLALTGCLKSDYYWIWLDQMNVELQGGEDP